MSYASQVHDVIAAITVLIVDDSLLVRAVVRSGLEDEGYHVVEATDGTSALSSCRVSPPDVILLDVEMPDLNGHQVLAELKHDPALRDIPVVFLTGRSSIDDVLTGLRGGAHDYLKKPFEPAELVARVGAAAHVKKLQDALRERNEQLEQVSRTDLLTGLSNRRHMEEELTRQHSIARRSHHNLGVIMLDIDHFKNVNDTYGHAAGDQVLAEFATRLQSQLRAGDTAGRWGGEEFLVILPDTDLDNTRQVAERICSATADTPVPIGGHEINMTVSGGCAVGPGARPHVLVKLADTQMYQAKQSGRNQIIAITSRNALPRVPSTTPGHQTEDARVSDGC
jgi:diguanylate cyclase (GGDEF)-like protein